MVAVCGILFMAVGSELKKIWSAITPPRNRLQTKQLAWRGLGGPPGLKMVWFWLWEVWEGYGGPKKRGFSEPGIEPGDSRWQRLMFERIGLRWSRTYHYITLSGGRPGNRCQFGKLNFFFYMYFASKGNPQSENLAFRLPTSPFDGKRSEVFGTE